MEIVYNEAQLAAYAESAPPILPDAPLLVDKYLRGLELEVDAVFDGDDVLIPASSTRRARGRSLRRFDRRLSRAVDRRSDGTAHRRITLPSRANSDPRPDQHSVRDCTTAASISSKPIRARAARCRSFRKPRASISWRRQRASRSAKSCATWSTAPASTARSLRGGKVPVFSFSKMRGVETILGPEMKSTGEVLGIDETFGGALPKGLSPPACACPRTRHAFSFRSPTKEGGVGRGSAALRRVRTRDRRNAGNARDARGGRHCDAGINKIADGSPHVSISSHRAASTS